METLQNKTKQTDKQQRTKQNKQRKTETKNITEKVEVYLYQLLLSSGV